MLAVEHVYLNSDNVTKLTFRSDYETVDHTANDTPDTLIDSHSHPTITRLVIKVLPIAGDSTDSVVTIDSDVDGFNFDLTDGEALVRLGQFEIKPGRHIAEVTLYDSPSSNGIRWGELVLIVK